jgi:hypothetical protein
MEEDKTMNEKINEIYKDVKEGRGRQKKFRMPIGIRLQKGKFKRKNYAVIQTVKNNGAVTFSMQKIEDDTIKLKSGTIHDASAENVLHYKKYPLIIVPEWNIKPFSPKEDFKEAADKGTLAAAEKLILTKLKLEAVKGKFQLNWKIILLLLVIGGALLYLLDYAQII